MSGKLPQTDKDSEFPPINIHVDGGVQSTPILLNNDFQGGLTCNFKYSGPVLPQGLGSGQPMSRNDGSINITNKGGVSHQPVFHGNRSAKPVDMRVDINIQQRAGQNSPGGGNIVQQPEAQNIVKDEEEGQMEVD